MEGRKQWADNGRYVKLFIDDNNNLSSLSIYRGYAMTARYKGDVYF